MANELNIFDVSSETPTDQWAHGSAAARAWLTGSLRAEDGLDLSGEFDAQFSGRFGADMLKGVASLSGDLTGAAHAGVRLQAGMPLDLFEAAGIIARLRLEASASVRASVTAAMSVGEMRQLVTGALPAESRPYVDIVLDEVTVGATVWARASFAAMVISELVAAIDLFPQDGSGPGVTAYFHYGFGWGYGAGWGVITNVGFDLKRMLRRMAGQAEVDLRTALEAYRTEEALDPNDPRALTTELAEVLLPLTLDALVSWCEQQLHSGDDEEGTSLGDSLAEAVRTLLADAILPRLLSFAGEKFIENVARFLLKRPTRSGASSRPPACISRGPRTIPPKPLGQRRSFSSGSRSSFPRTSAPRSAKRSLRGRDHRPRERLRGPESADRALVGRGDRAATLKVLAGLVLGDELVDSSRTRACSRPG